jgi:FkbM family methyltransferase
VDSGEYESGEITIVSKTLEKTDIVLELGTGLGFLSAYCSKIIGSERVQTFEANPELRSLIQKTYKKNNVFPELHFAAIGADEGETDFYISKSGFFTSSTLKSKMAKKMIVPVRGINNVLRALKPTYLLMDIEGGELEIFRSIDFCCIQKIQFELHPQFLSEKEVSDIFSILGRNGFNRITDLEQGNNYYFKRC